MYEKYWEQLEQALMGNSEGHCISVYEEYKIVQLVKRSDKQWPEYRADGINNVWIVKPGYNSRGVGVHCVQGLREVPNTKQPKVVQKYIEKVLLIEGRKFDIRQWVLVTSVAPLKVFVFKEAYLKICSQAFDLTDLSNRARHLANYSLQKKQHVDPKDITYSSKQFVEYLISRGYVDDQNWWDSFLFPQLSSIIVETLLAAGEAGMEQHSSCFQLFGFDFVLDEDLRPWLLQINLSPACAERLDWLKEMLGRMASGLLNIIEHKFEEEQTHQALQLNGWECVYDDKQFICANSTLAAASTFSNPQHAGLQILGFPLKTVKHQRALGRQIATTRAVLLLQRGVRCWLARLQLLRLKYERSAIIIQENSFQWRKKLMARKAKRDAASQKLRKLLRFFETKTLLREWKQAYKDKAAERIQGLLKIKRAVSLKNKLRIQRSFDVISQGFKLRKKRLQFIVMERSLRRIQRFYSRRFRMKKAAASRIGKAFRNWRVRRKIKKIKAGLRLGVKREKFLKWNAFKKYIRCNENYEIASVLIWAFRARKIMQGFNTARISIIQSRFRELSQKYKRIQILSWMNSLAKLRVSKARTLQKWFKKMIVKLRRDKRKREKEKSKAVKRIVQKWKKYQEEKRARQLKLLNKSAVRIQAFFRMCLARAKFTRYKLSLLRHEAKQQSSRNFLALKESDFSNPSLRGQLLALSNRLIVKKHRSKSVFMNRSTSNIQQSAVIRKDWSSLRSKSIRPGHRLASLKQISNGALFMQKIQERPAPVKTSVDAKKNESSSGLGSYGSRLKKQLQKMLQSRKKNVLEM